MSTLLASPIVSNEVELDLREAELTRRESAMQREPSISLPGALRASARCSAPIEH